MREIKIQKREIIKKINKNKKVKTLNVMFLELKYFIDCTEFKHLKFKL